jgi:steroid delta-isomerase-like uncharacterized protein
VGLTLDARKRIYRSVIEAISRGDEDALDQLLAAEIVDHNPLPDQQPGIAGFKAWMRAVRTIFPDLHGTVEDVVAEGELVAARVTWTGTQQGAFLGRPASGRPVAFTAFHIVRFDGDRIAEWWGAANPPTERQVAGEPSPSPERQQS